MDERSLSERELRILAEIEERLHAEDPDLPRRFRKVDTRDARRRLKFAIPAAVVGLALLFAFTVEVVYGIVGFGVLLVSVTAIVSAVKEILAARMARVPRLRVAPQRDPRDSNE